MPLHQCHCLARCRHFAPFQRLCSSLNTLGKRMICVMWYRLFNMISVTKRANGRRSCMAGLQILLGGWLDAYGIHCNYKVYEENDILYCNSPPEFGLPQSAQRQGFGLHDPRLKSRNEQEIFRFSQTSRQTLGSTEPPNQCAPCYIHGGKAAVAWCWPLISFYRRGYEWVDLYAGSLRMESWRGQQQLYIYLHFFVRRYVKWATVVVQCL
jgi:hypothetical protein